MVDEDTLADLLTEAMRAKARDLGREKYTYRDLGVDAQVDYSYAQKTVKYGRVPSRDIIRAWAVALHPHFPLDEALVAAGYTPDGPEQLAFLRAAVRLTNEEMRRLLHSIGTRSSRPIDRQPGADDTEDDPDEQP